ncbi:olfactory receptor 8S1 [Otolemur garnettii]|uniref:olfactory receptor 8S1 n=1 Tax=Otolemur garnettii TaxID=30611 RepID=UPI00027411AB|nr:olfactory receptor 8S1 [Otolemur garnettii]
MALGNNSTITEFLLLGLSADPDGQALLFVLFLVIYLLTIMGNLLLLLLIRTDSHLHTPMYFFLSHLSFVDLCFSSVTVPKMLQNLLSQRKTISVEGCLTQVFFVFVAAGTEACLLSVMAYDRYAAICHPLLYGQIMSKQLYMYLAWGSWALGFLDALINILLAVNMVFCGPNLVRSFACELPPVLLLACSDPHASIASMLTTMVVLGLSNIILLLGSYSRIITTALRVNSAAGRSKIFSTCSSHFLVLVIFYGSGCSRYMTPASGSALEQVLSVQYSVVTPMLNPLIYSLKNQEVKTALKRMLARKSRLTF